MCDLRMVLAVFIPTLLYSLKSDAILEEERNTINIQHNKYIIQLRKQKKLTL